MAFFKCSGGQNPTGDAVAADVLSGKTFSNANGINLTGTMTNRGTVTQTLNTSTTSYTIPKGYHSGSGKVSISTQTKTVTSSRSAQTVTPDSGKVLSSVTVNALAPTGTFSATTRNASVDMGATSNYRYVDTTGVPNVNSGTYTFPSGSTGATYDMGSTNTIRKVNAANVYNQGKADGATDLTKIQRFLNFQLDGSDTYATIDQLNLRNDLYVKKFYMKVVSSTSYISVTGKNSSGTAVSVVSRVKPTTEKTYDLSYNDGELKTLIFTFDFQRNNGRIVINELLVEYY
jgi:hypothetical protein